MDKKKPDEKILERIRRLLAMAKDASSPNEAGIAARRAQKLMEEYNLENIESILSDLEDDDNVEEEVVTKFKVAGNSKKVAKEIPIWCNRLSVAVARLFDCEVKQASAYEKTGVPGSVAIGFYGYKTDLAVCKWTFEYLLDQIRKFNRDARKRYGQGNRSLLSDYRLGLITGVLEVLGEAREEKERTKQAVASTGTALVVMKHDAIVKKFGNFRYHASRGVQDVDARAWGEGVVDGRSIRLSQPLAGPAKKPALQGA